MATPYENIMSTVEVEVEWLEKLNEEKCDLDKVLTRVKRDIRIFKRNFIEIISDKLGFYQRTYLGVIKDLNDTVEEIKEIQKLTPTYKRMLIRLFNSTKSQIDGCSHNYLSYTYASRNVKNALPEINNIRCINSNRKIKVFTPNVEDLDFVKKFNRDKFDIYASSEDEHYYSRLKGNVDYRIYGSLNLGARISNDFDVVMSVPKYNTYHREGALKDKEKVEIINTIRYLRNNGLYILIFPYSRFTDEILMLIANRLSNLKLSIIDEEHSIAMLTGTKQEFKRKDVSAEDYALLISYMEEEYQLLIDNKINFAEYYVPEEESEITFFRGSKISKEEMCNYCSESGLVDDFLNEEETIEVKDTRPLLPFNIGQVGLVLTSSQLNGIVNDENGIPHLIKGMTVKDTNRSEEHIGDEIKSTEIVANRVQINIMSADGEIIKIS